MILLKKIELTDFLSHKDTTLEFNEDDKILIEGTSGAGKSSIFEAIIWCLYGQGRADNRSLVRRGTVKSTVSLTLRKYSVLEAKEEIVIIRRTITLKGKHTLEISIQHSDGTEVALPATGVRELQNWIDKDLIGASYLLFVNSVAYIQGNPESFVTQNAPKRKELLLEILKADDYDTYYEKAREKLSDLSGDAQNAQGQVSALNTQIKGTEERITHRSAFLEAIKASTVQLAELTPQKKELETKKDTILGHLKTIDILETTCLSSEKEILMLESDINEKIQRITSKTALQEQTKEKPSLTSKKIVLEQQLERLQHTLTEETAFEVERNAYLSRKPEEHDPLSEIQRIQEELALYKAKEPCPAGNNCPYDRQRMKIIDVLEKNLKDHTSKLQTETALLSEWRTEGTRFQKETNLNTVAEKIHNTQKTLRTVELALKNIYETESELKSIEGLEQQISTTSSLITKKKTSVGTLREEIKDSKKIVSEKDKIFTALSEILIEERRLQDAITRATVGLESIDKDVQELKSLEQKYADLQTNLKVIEKQILKITLVRDAFGPKGIKTMVIDYLLPQLEDKINEILGLLTDFRVRLDTQKQSADGEHMVEGLFITILNESNEEMPFEAYSGGEKLKISVAISEALASLQQVSFRIFDETFMGLDENSTESFADVLQRLTNKFNQVFCISHLLQIQEMFSKKIMITKNNRLSSAKKRY